MEAPGTIDHHRGRVKSVKLGFDYVHVAVEAHSRLAFAQILPDEKGTTCAAFLTPAAEFFARRGIRIGEVMTDNAKNYTVLVAFQGELVRLDAKHITTRPHCPWQNGKAECFNRTTQESGLPHALRFQSAPRRRAHTMGLSATIMLVPTPPAAASPDQPGVNLMAEYT